MNKKSEQVHKKIAYWTSQGGRAGTGTVESQVWAIKWVELGDTLHNQFWELINILDACN